jgi:DNA-binding winged helix-turn-helix (wHTH) protein
MVGESVRPIYVFGTYDAFMQVINWLVMRGVDVVGAGTPLPPGSDDARAGPLDEEAPAEPNGAAASTGSQGPAATKRGTRAPAATERSTRTRSRRIAPTVPLVIDRESSTVTAGDHHVRLSAKSISLLHALSLRQGRVVPTSLLRHEIWGDAPMHPGTISELVRCVRRRLVHSGLRWIEIQSVGHGRRSGYRLVAHPHDPDPDAAADIE